MLFQEILKSCYGSQAVNGILTHSARIKTKGKELVKIIIICDSCAHEFFFFSYRGF